MFEGFLAAYPVGRDPLKHLRYKICALINVFLRIVLEWKDLPEITARRVIQLVHQINRVRRDLPADPLKSLTVRQAEQSNLLNQLGALRLAREQRSQSHEFGEDATDGPNINLLRII